MNDADIATPDASRSFWKSFGPGLMWAGTAIGVSHLVQSTRAGASAGFAFAGVIFFALLLKYPFFDFAPRYSAATGMSLVEGYKRVGRWALWLYFLIVVTTVVPTVSAIVLLNSFLLQFAFGLSGSTMPIVVALFVVIGGLLWVGHFKLLDLSMKLVLLVLSVCTLIGAAMVLPRVSFATFSLSPLPLQESVVPYAFLLALAGWMPSDIAVSVYASLWTLAKDESTGGRTSVRNARLDFLIGYVGTAILAFAFLTLGAGVMFGSGVALSDSGGVFATQLVNLYSSTLGTWIRPIMMVSAVTAIFSTSLGVLDGFPRVLERCWNVLRTDDMRAVGRIPSGRPYWVSFVLIALLSIVLLSAFVGKMTTMIDFATTMAFLTAPVLGYINLRAIRSHDVPAEHHPGPAMLALAWTGLVVLTVTAVVFIVFQLF